MRKKKEWNGGELRMPKYVPKSENQKNYVAYLSNPDTPIVLGVGPAGCGKTLFACVDAIQKLQSGSIRKIIITRPIVPVEEEELGFLPGNLIHKMDPWTRPIFDIFLEYYQQRDLDAMLMTGAIEIAPLAYMRGRTFKRSFIIADEMQNSTPNQMMMLTTRIGLGSKMVITGDLKQTDRSAQNGLSDFMVRLKRYNENHLHESIKMVEMNHSDIERSPIVSQVLDIYKQVLTVPTVLTVPIVPTVPTIISKNSDSALIPKEHEL
uniref:PhoH-like protein n=1 Tax=viral metagenome TaxID=1070528 RepID=A0A6C0I371_9ZZZZ